MRGIRVGLWMIIMIVVAAGAAMAQATTGTMRGHVGDAQGLALPGVTVTATSPNLQGTRSAVTSENGDYVLTLLPSGSYTVSFELSGFEQQQRTVALAPMQDLPLDVKLGIATLTETVQVVGSDVIRQTPQVTVNYSQELI